MKRLWCPVSDAYEPIIVCELSCDPPVGMRLRGRVCYFGHLSFRVLNSEEREIDRK